MYHDNVDTSTLSDEKDTISQSELTGLTECDVSICDDSDDEFFREEEWPNPEHMVIPRMAVDNVNRTVINRNNNRGRCSGPEMKMTLPVMKILVRSTGRSQY